MSKPRIGVVSPTEVAFPTVSAAFAELWPEAEPVCVLDQSLYADFINADMTVPDVMPEGPMPGSPTCYAMLKTAVRTASSSVGPCLNVCSKPDGTR